MGGVVGGGLGGLIINGWTGALIIPCVVAGVVGGGVSGGLGQAFSYGFDEPRIRWNQRSAFLFSLWFTLFFSMLFGLLALPLEHTAVASGPFNWVTFGVAGVSAFLATTLPGVLNNLRDTEEARPPAKDTGRR